jgi:hypothetical protein
VMDSPSADLQSLPEGIEALRALVLTTMSERDALVLERDTLQTRVGASIGRRLHRRVMSSRRAVAATAWADGRDSAQTVG